MINSLRSRESLSEESGLNVVNSLRSRESHWEKSDLNMVIRPKYSIDVNICICVKGLG